MSRRVSWVVLWSLWAARLVPQRGPVVSTRQGALQGTLASSSQHYEYLGVPYGDSSHVYRFKAPGAAPRWEGVRRADDAHVRCAQRWGPLVVGREDCLVLNVYVPARETGARLRPVMFFIHGGGFLEGSGAPLLYGPDYLVDKDVILVTFNYRLGVLGFLCLHTEEAPGNAGLKDQVAALRWVRDNIAAFGGDPDNVTIFGESAGGTSVSYHLVSSASRGLFHRAIVQSGSSTAPWATQPDPLGVARSLAEALGHKHDDPHMLYQIFMNETFTTLVRTQTPRMRGQLKFLHLPFRPCVERPQESPGQAFVTDLPHRLYTSGMFNRVPVIIGSNDQEGYFFASMEDDESLNNISIEASLPGDLVFTSEDERRAAALEVHSLYLDERRPSWDGLVELSKLHGEPYFNYPVQHETELLQQAGASVYSYVFRHDGWRNFPKLIAGARFWRAPGATHADELFYMFSLFPTPVLFESDMIRLVTTYWTDFAKYGEPGGGWRQASAGSMQLGAAPHMSTRGSMAPPHARLWRHLYHKYRRTSH